MRFGGDTGTATRPRWCREGLLVPGVVVQAGLWRPDPVLGRSALRATLVPVDGWSRHVLAASAPLRKHRLTQRPIRYSPCRSRERSTDPARTVTGAPGAYLNLRVHRTVDGRIAKTPRSPGLPYGRVACSVAGGRRRLPRLPASNRCRRSAMALRGVGGTGGFGSLRDFGQGMPISGANPGRGMRTQMGR